MPNDIVVRSDKDGGKVHLSADRVYDLNEDKTQDVINSEFKTLMNLDSEVAIVIDGRSCTLGAVAGQYVILQNSTIAGKSDGLYTAAQTIPTGATNVTADMLSSPIPRGGLNALNNSKVSTSAIANNLTTSAEGYVLDARQGTALNTALNSKAETDASNISASVWRTALGLNGLTADTYIVANNGSVAISISSATSAFLIFSGAGSNGVGAYIVYTNTSGNAGLTLVGGNNTGITPTYTTNKITIANSTGYVRYILVLRY